MLLFDDKPITPDVTSITSIAFGAGETERRKDYLAKQIIKNPWGKTGRQQPKHCLPISSHQTW